MTQANTTRPGRRTVHRAKLRQTLMLKGKCEFFTETTVLLSRIWEGVMAIFEP